MQTLLNSDSIRRLAVPSASPHALLRHRSLVLGAILLATILLVPETLRAQPGPTPPATGQVPGTPAVPKAPAAEGEDALSGFQSLPFHESMIDQAQRNAIMAEVRTVLSGEADLQSKKNQVNTWYVGYLIPQMTRTDEFENCNYVKSLADLPKLRDVLRNSLKTAKTPDVHDYLVELILRKMREIARGKYHPAARYNAVLLIGELNAKEATQNPLSPAEPSVPAFLVLTEELVHPDQIDACRVASLLGMLRHLKEDNARTAGEIRIRQQERELALERVLPVAAKVDPPEGRTAAGHAWMRARAAEVIGELRLAGKTVSGKLDYSALKTLRGMVEETDSPQTLRTSAAVALGRIPIPASGFDAAAAAKSVGGMGVSLFKRIALQIEAELKAEEALKNPEGPEGPDPLESPTRLDVARRRVRQLTTAIDASMDGLAKSQAAAPVAVSIKPITKSLAEVVTPPDITTSDLTRVSLIRELRKAAIDLEKLVGSGGSKPADPPPSDVFP